MNKRKIHDGIVGVMVITGVALGYYLSPAWLWIPLIVGVILLQSAFSGCCPVYYTLDKIEPENERSV